MFQNLNVILQVRQIGKHIMADGLKLYVKNESSCNVS